MKRIYLIGAALLLFLFFGISYFANKPATDATNNNDLQPANSMAGMIPPADNVPAVENTVSDVKSSGIVPESVATKGNGVKHRAKKSSYVRTRMQSNEPVNNAKLVSYVQDREVAVETSNEYNANLPVAHSKKVIRIRPAANNDTKGCRLCKIFNGRVGFGPELGFNQNGVTNSPSNMLTGNVHAGLIFNFNLGGDVAFQPGLRYIIKGTKSMDQMDVNANEKLTMHYLELPADFVFKFGKPNNARIMVGAGPYISYLLSARDRYNSDNGGYVDVIGAQPQYNTSSIQKVDYGLNAFLGCITPEGIYAKAGAELGMRDLQESTAYGVNATRNYSFLFSVGYILGGHK